MKTKRAKLGDILKIPIHDNRWSYGCVTPNNGIGFYDILTDKDLAIDEIAQKPILFRVMLNTRAFNGKEWPVVGNIQLLGDLAKPQRFLHIDSDLDAGEYLATTDFDDKIPISKEEAKTLDLLSVYDPVHAEQQLRDHFEGKPNAHAIAMRLVH